MSAKLSGAQNVLSASARSQKNWAWAQILQLSASAANFFERTRALPIPPAAVLGWNDKWMGRRNHPINLLLGEKWILFYAAASFLSKWCTWVKIRPYSMLLLLFLSRWCEYIQQIRFLPHYPKIAFFLLSAFLASVSQQQKLAEIDVVDGGRIFAPKFITKKADCGTLIKQLW